MRKYVLLLFVATVSIMRCAMASDPAAVLRDHQGLWLGKLTLPDGRSLGSGVDIFTRADGSVWASYASPDRRAFDVPVVAIHTAGEKAQLDLIFATLALTWRDDHFIGEWKQGGSSIVYDLHAVAQFPRVHRPQDPKPPFPYHEESLAIPSVNGVVLSATLTLPDSNPHPDLAILVHGSGPQTRDEEGGGHRTFAVLADQLVRQGIAVLRYDKRGVSRSTGDYEHHTQKDLIDDLTAVVHAMRARRQFGHVGLIGHSEGPMIAAAVAARHPTPVDFLVSLAGVGLSGMDMIMLQDRAYAMDNGARGLELERLMRFSRRWYEIVVAQPEAQTRVAALKKFRNGLTAADRALIEKYKMNEGSLSLQAAEDPALRVVLMADPQKYWRAVRCPVLALNGALDHQVPPESLAGIVAALHAGGNRHVQSAVLPSLNHLFQTAKTGTEDEYETIEETIAPDVVRRIARFIGASSAKNEGASG